ncbi:GM15989 [Drosophila sechellia]|uniref:GM15989 n=1 Tax=Drosophila sechellia TaxID=7238 RepID=B4I8H6_DROSE|nr:GM15989 [Drosophila sechellia]
MDRIKIGEQLLFQRSDGRVHQVVCTAKNLERDSITGEWTEGTVVKGKEVPLSTLIGINHHIFAENQPPISKPSNSLLPKPRGSSPPGGPNTHTGNPYAERMRVPDGRSKIATRKTDPAAVGARNRQQAIAHTPRVPACRTERDASPTQGRKSQGGNNSNQRCSSVVREVNRMKEQREKRRARQAEQLQEKDALRRNNPGNPNWEVSSMLRQYRSSLIFSPLRCVDPNGATVQQISVCVRKRPMSRKEENSKNLDIITVPSADSLIVHELRLKVDLTKFLEHHKFRFDYTFDEECSNALVYNHTARPLIKTMFEGGNATCFAYGQTGSGKTHTMGGESSERFRIAEPGSTPWQPGMSSRSFFEIYGTKVFDLLLPNKPMLRVLEDARQQVVVVGLTEMPVTKVEDVLRLIEHGSKERTSGQTSANAKSSRSHAVFQIALHMPDSWGPYGKCSFVDLAGNERGADTQSADRQTRIEGADINKSLLALKECIRALSRQSSHLPFRGSKLTQVLRDSFVGGKKNKTCMIAMISPSMSCVENTLNTLRYADRVKELIAKEDDILQSSSVDGVGEKSADLDDESEPEMMADEEGDEEPEDEENQHITTISSEEASSYNNMSYDMNYNHTLNILGPSRTVDIQEVAEQHALLVEYLENYANNFRQLKTDKEMDQYTQNSESALLKLLAMVNRTRDVTHNYNTHKLLKEENQNAYKEVELADSD